MGMGVLLKMCAVVSCSLVYVIDTRSSQKHTAGHAYGQAGAWKWGALRSPGLRLETPLTADRQLGSPQRTATSPRVCVDCALPGELTSKQHSITSLAVLGSAIPPVALYFLALGRVRHWRCRLRPDGARAGVYRYRLHSSSVPWPW